jgi:hypothetical protein
MMQPAKARKFNTMSHRFLVTSLRWAFDPVTREACAAAMGLWLESWQLAWGPSAARPVRPEDTAGTGRHQTIRLRGSCCDRPLLGGQRFVFSRIKPGREDTSLASPDGMRDNAKRISPF